MSVRTFTFTFGENFDRATLYVNGKPSGGRAPIAQVVAHRGTWRVSRFTPPVPASQEMLRVAERVSGLILAWGKDWWTREGDGAVRQVMLIGDNTMRLAELFAADGTAHQEGTT